MITLPLPRLLHHTLGIGLATGLLSLAPGASAFILTNGIGDGRLRISVDGYGSSGMGVVFPGDGLLTNNDAFYDPLGPIPSDGTIFESGVAFRLGSSGPRTFLSSGTIGDIYDIFGFVVDPGSGNLPAVGVTGTATSANSAFNFGGLAFNLNQTLTDLFTGTSQSGTRLTQTYQITNSGTSAVPFELLRYLDGDLLFDGSFSGDGGGRIITSTGEELLFETDQAAGTSDPTTFIGISVTGGTSPANNYEVGRYSDLVEAINNGLELLNVVVEDGADSDQFVDAGLGYDITLALSRNFTLGAGQSTTFTTSTFFGSGAPQQLTPLEPPIVTPPVITPPVITPPVVSPPTTSVPEPGSWAGVIALGAIGQGLRRRRQAA